MPPARAFETERIHKENRETVISLDVCLNVRSLAYLLEMHLLQPPGEVTEASRLLLS